MNRSVFIYTKWSKKGERWRWGRWGETAGVWIGTSTNENLISDICETLCVNIDPCSREGSNWVSEKRIRQEIKGCLGAQVEISRAHPKRYGYCSGEIRKPNETKHTKKANRLWRTKCEQNFCTWTVIVDNLVENMSSYTNISFCNGCLWFSFFFPLLCCVCTFSGCCCLLHSSAPST